MNEKKKLSNGCCAPKKYSLARSKKLGRYIVAARDIPAGELIFREDALAVGPAIFATGPFCFGCMRPLMTKAQISCSKCDVAPLCNRACEKVGSRCHSTAECDLFRQNKNLYLDNLDEVTRILLHLRLWLLRDGDSWSKIESMEAHLEQRRGKPVWRERETGVVDIFRKLGLHPSEENGKNPKGDEEDESIQWLCGVADVNTFELRAPGLNEEVGPLRGLFLEASLMAHECRPTAHVSVDEGFHMSVHAAVDLPAGGLISFNYTSSLLGTIDRQEHLWEGKYFRCECKVCRDPLESDSYLSCILCPRCKKDYVALQNADSRDPYSAKTKWQCRRCKRIFKGCLIGTTIDIGRSLVDDVNEADFEAMDKLLKRLERTFHRNHYLLLSLKNKILVVCRREISGNVNPRRKMLQRMMDLCREVLQVMEIVEPGLSRLKGILLYEMHLPITILANRAYAAREIDARELLSRLQEAKELLRRSLTMLLLEPATTPEGQLAKRALQEMKLLGLSVDDVRALASSFGEQDVPNEIKKQQRRRGRNSRHN